MDCPLTLFEGDIGMGEADALQEGNNAGDGLDLADFDLVTGCSGPGRDQKLLNPFVTDGPQNPDTMPVRALLVGLFLADNFDAIAAGDQIAESGFCDHIWCFVS